MPIIDLNKTEYPPFSVLMSLYYKEKPEYLESCLESLLKQTCQAQEWVIVKDGPLGTDLDRVLEKYIEEYPNLITLVPIEKNVGLGLALEKGTKSCKYELIARMDTDDIAREDRFEKQLRAFMDDPQLDICGSHIKEFEGDKNYILSLRKVPLTQDNIVAYQKRRSAFNHMTVMYKKSSVIKAGNYEHAPLMEDDMLWTRMLLAGCKGKNIDDFLVWARTGKEMIAIRGGYAYFKKYKKSRKKIYETGFISYWDYLYTIIVQFIVALIPGKLRMIIFLKALRQGEK